MTSLSAFHYYASFLLCLLFIYLCTSPLTHVEIASELTFTFCGNCWRSFHRFTLTISVSFSPAVNVTFLLASLLDCCLTCINHFPGKSLVTFFLPYFSDLHPILHEHHQIHQNSTHFFFYPLAAQFNYPHYAYCTHFSTHNIVFLP